MNPMDSINILYVEDNKGDVQLLKHAFKYADFHPHLTVLEDGATAMDFIKKRGDFSAAVLPDFILLDLNLPKKSGYEVLKEIKEDPNLSPIPVIVLTSSKNPQDQEKCLGLKAMRYCVKPTDFYQLVEFVKFLKAELLSTTSSLIP
jgi:two-component system, chemotaxis family, response regulator Rcp1